MKERERLRGKERKQKFGRERGVERGEAFERGIWSEKGRERERERLRKRSSERERMRERLGGRIARTKESDRERGVKGGISKGRKLEREKILRRRD